MSIRSVGVSFVLGTIATSAFALQLPSQVAAEATGPNGAIVSYSASGTGPDDINGRPSSNVTCSPASGSLFAIGTTTVTCTGAEGSGSFPVIVSDTTGPKLSLPASIVEKASGPSGKAIAYSATATDLVDGNVAVACTPPSGSTFAIGTTTVTCSAHDSRGNQTSGSFSVTIEQGPPPPPPLPDVTAEATGPDGANVSFAISSDGTQDDHNGRPTGTCSPTSGSKFPLGATNVTCTNGTFKVHVVDTTAPKLHLPRGITLQATSSAGAIATFDASASDLVDGNVSVTCAPPSGSTFAIGTTAVTCSANDSRNNHAAESFDVVVQPAAPPPADITVEATGSDGATVTFAQGGSNGPDDENGRPSGGCSPASGSKFPLGTTTVQCANGSFHVTVVDTTAPSLFVPNDFSVQATSASGAMVTFNATANDLVDGSVSVVCTPPSGSTFAVGSNVVTCMAGDTRGNNAAATFTITVTNAPPPADHEAPAIASIHATPDEIKPPNGKLVDVTLTVDVSDDHDPAPLVRIFDVTANEAIDASDWFVQQPLVVALRADRDPHGSGRIYTIFVEAIDASGNRSTASVNVLVPHDSSALGDTTAAAPPAKKRAVRKP